MYSMTSKYCVLLFNMWEVLKRDLLAGLNIRIVVPFVDIS